MKAWAVAGISLLILSLPLLTAWSGPEGGGDRVSGRPFATRSPVLGRHGMAATSQPLASQIAIDILKRGGSAVDAAIAANAALALMEPTGCGLGGDLFAIVWDPASRKLHGLNASGPSPQALTREKLQGELGSRQQIPLFGPLPISVPGAVDGWVTLHERFGRLPLGEVLAPAIGYAREGFPVSQVIAHYLAANFRRFERNRDQLTESANLFDTFTPGGTPAGEGEVFRNPDLARTLERIAQGGRDAFYDGPIAETIDAYCRRVGCYLRRQDLADFHSEWVEPISTSYRGVDVFELPPNGQGLAALQMLNILEGYDLKSLGHNSAATLHLQIEAKKLAYEDRARHYADPRFYEVPLQRLLSKKHAASQRRQISPERALLSISGDDPRLEEGDTIYLSVADERGMMVSWIQSNYVGMGSGLVPDGLGFVLQNRGALFHLAEGHANVYAPGKRPFHTIIPGFAMREGQPWLSFGVMGGAMQPQGHVQVLCNLIDFGMNVQEAGDAARFNHSGSSQPTGEVMTDGGSVSLESGIPPEVRLRLAYWGHRLNDDTGGFGGYQAVLWDPVQRVYHGASEMRKDGQAVGY